MITIFLQEARQRKHYHTRRNAQRRFALFNVLNSNFFGVPIAFHHFVVVLTCSLSQDFELYVQNRKDYYHIYLILIPSPFLGDRLPVNQDRENECMHCRLFIYKVVYQREREKERQSEERKYKRKYQERDRRKIHSANPFLSKCDVAVETISFNSLMDRIEPGIVLQ